MPTRLLPGPRKWSMTRDGDGHRNYKITFRIQCAVTDGPTNALLTPGLPVPGAVWAVDGDYDPWAFCHFDAEVEQESPEGEPNEYFDLTFLFTTKPLRRCADQHFEDPLLEPQIISGGFSNHQLEGVDDRFGNTIENSAHELVQGPTNEWEVSYPIVRIKQNVAVLQLPLLKAMIDHVNVEPLWGMERREVRLNSVSYEQKFYGTCSYYWERHLEFHIKDGTFDRNLRDLSNKVLNGHWDLLSGDWVLDKIGGKSPDPNDPTHFIDFPDRNNNPIRGILNGKGVPAKVIVRSGLVEKGVKYVAIVGGIVGQKLSDTTKWRVMDVPNPADPPIWEQTTYAHNQIVDFPFTINAGIYIALVDVFSDIEDDPPDNPSWRFLKDRNVGVVDKGIYNAASTYALGDYVIAPPGTKETEGQIHIEYYYEANFLLLGIPADIGP